MEVKLNVQQNGVNTLKERFEIHSSKNLKKVYIVAGEMKESGFNILEEFLIDLKARKYFVIGIDRKNTTRRMLEELCKYTKNVYVHNNNYDEELNSSIYIFEYDAKSFVYIVSGGISESNMTTDICTYTEIVFDLSVARDKDEYKGYVEKIIKVSKTEKFINIDKAYVAKLVEDKEIFSTKQYTHNVMSISELLNKKGVATEDNPSENLEEPKINIPKLDLDDINEFSLDIDISDAEEKVSKIEEEITSSDISFENLKEREISQEIIDGIEDIEQEELPTECEEYEVSSDVIDMESMLFKKSSIKLNSKTKKEEKREELKSRKVDLAKVSNLFIELPKKPSSEKEAGEIKIPNYIKELISNFFEKFNKQKIEVLNDGNSQKRLNIVAELVDINSNSRYKCPNSSIIERLGKTYISIELGKLKDIYYEEGDMARIIKLSNDMYHIEIIPKTCEEYRVWKKLCTTPMRGTTRCYGIM